MKEENNKVEATRVLLYDKITGSIIAAHPTGRPWKKNGGMAIGVFTLPGGIIDEGEDIYEGAIREVKEECSLDIDKSELRYLGHYDYILSKSLHMFLYDAKNLDIKKLKCDSFFEDEHGNMRPEVNGFSKFNLESEMHMFFPVLQKVLKKVIAEHPEEFHADIDENLNHFTEHINKLTSLVNQLE